MTITAPERTQTAHRVPLSLVQPTPPPSWPPRYVRPLRIVPPLTKAPLVPRRPRSTRITRRGRLVLTLTVVAVIGLLSLVASRSPASHPGRAAPAGSVVVQPGDTLWAVAVRADPHADPRVTVDRIVRLNGLADVSVRPGQHLRLPDH
ncbi:MAG: hypothetical protein DLM59_05210 [Pseudonocardiales bacterium]|nr:MAG: hypothetical protein DLM59_05210 [Pseudonocardiales bacterium]